MITKYQYSIINKVVVGWWDRVGVVVKVVVMGWGGSGAVIWWLTASIILRCRDAFPMVFLSTWKYLLRPDTIFRLLASPGTTEESKVLRTNA